MPNPYKNHEYYSDPTAYHALAALEREAKSAPYRTLVFICSPYAGDVETNVANARRYSAFAVSRGYIPVAPHLLFPQFMDDGNKSERNLALFFGIVLLGKCSALWVFGNTVSDGMALEIEKALNRHICIRCFNDSCEEVSGMSGVPSDTSGIVR